MAALPPLVLRVAGAPLAPPHASEDHCSLPHIFCSILSLPDQLNQNEIIFLSNQVLLLSFPTRFFGSYFTIRVLFLRTLALYSGFFARRLRSDSPGAIPLTNSGIPQSQDLCLFKCCTFLFVFFCCVKISPVSFSRTRDLVTAPTRVSP